MPIKDSNTISLLRFDESVNKDSCGIEWKTNGALSLSTDIHKFGNSSLNTTGGGYLTSGDRVCDFGYNDFTVDCWVYSPTANKDTSNMIIAGYTNLCMVIHTGYFCIGQSYWPHNGVFTPVLTNFENMWHHYACVRKDGTVYLFVDGKLQIAKEWNLNCVTGGSGYTYIGAEVDGTHHLYYYLDELRISNIARWTDDFTPPTSYGVNSLYEDKIDNYYGMLKE